MGLKRPFDAEEMQECNAKHARQLDYSPKQLNQSYEAIPYHVPFEKTGSLVEDLSVEKKPTWSYDTCVPVSIPESGLCQEDLTRSFSDVTWRPISPVEDVYTCLMNYPPRKQIPVGFNHQAEIREYDEEEMRNDDLERKLMGKCIIPLSETDSDECGLVGQGRQECICLDKGSIRCVRRHISEARRKLIETLGYGKFMELGFCEMGDEVASLWTEDEEDLFHKVVYSNPASLGRDFWKQLKATFPSRKVKELVSYYFNVFILRRRATQNRFKSVDVDSDDDEWQVEYDVFYSANNGKSSSHDNEEEDNDSSDEDDDGEGGGGGEESPINDVHCVYMDKVSGDDGGVGEELNVEDDSCMSFELQDSNLIYSHNPIENRDCHRSGDDDHSYSFDDDRRLASDRWNKNNDLLPTSNMIEEIFGQDEWGDNSNGDSLKGK